MSYLEKYDTALKSDPRQAVGLIAGWLRTDWRPFFAELRASRPILATPAFTLVTRYPDVLEVLSRPRDFSVRIYAGKMDPVVAGPFMLARDETPINWREKGLMQFLLSPDDMPAVRRMAGAFADSELKRAAAAGRIDVVSCLGRLVPVRICGKYFGFPGPDVASMFRWSRATQGDMFKNLAGDPAVHAASVQAGNEMMAYLADRLVRLRRNRRKADNAGGSTAAPADIFNRLVALRMPDDVALDDHRILANMAGLLIGSVETSSQAIVQALQQLLSRPDVLAAAQAAANADANADNLAEFDRYVWEALRFNPINPLVFRFCERETALGAGKPWATVIPAGARVFACTASAMFDADLFPAPDDFVPDRPSQLSLHFGYGHHVCLGLHVGLVMIPEVIRRVLLQPGVHLLPSPEGDIDFRNGPFPEQFVIGLGK